MEQLIVGFTGTRDGMTGAQKRVITMELAPLGADHQVIGLHGDCVGADADFHAICVALGYEVWIRPCTFENLRAHCDGRVIADPVGPMVRNREIVNQADRMLAAPPTAEMLKRSGTWATVRMAMKRQGCQVVAPDGNIMRAKGVIIV